MRRWKKWTNRISEPASLLLAFLVGHDVAAHGWRLGDIVLGGALGLYVLIDVLWAFLGLFESGGSNGPTKDH